MTLATAISTTTSSNGLTATPSGSPIDVAGIVSQLMATEQQPLTNLQNQATAFQSTISAYGTVNSALSTFQSALASLESGATFGTLSASASDASVLSASAGTGAAPGTHSVQVTQLAQAQQIASSGYANTSDAVGTGTLTFQFGTFDGTSFTANGGATQSVVIGSGQQTLAGIRDAVNAAGIGVTATIVNDGSANGNRLVFSSSSSGVANSLKITVADTDGNGVDTAGLSQLAFDPAAAVGNGRNMSQTVAAQNALLVIDGISVSKPSNTISDALQGVTLNLAKTSVGTPTTVTVSQDSTAATQAVQNFVTAYNAMQATLGALTKFDATTDTASILTGDSTVRLIQSQLSAVIGSSISGASDNLNSLWQVGVTLQSDGTLALNSSKLAAAISANGAGLGQLFAAVGKASDSQIAVSTTGTGTQPGTYAVNVTQLATRGSLAADSAAGLTIVAGVNDQLAITVDGVSTTVTLAAGTYANSDALSAEVQSRINGATALTAVGSSVSVQETGGVLTIQSNRYGSASSIAVSGSAAAGLFGSSPTSTTGIDVAGTIGGVAARGSGQTLFAAAGSAAVGLQLQVTGGATGARGSVSYTQGYAAQFDKVLTPMLAANGILAARTDGLNTSITQINLQETKEQARLNTLQAQFTQQYSALNGLLASMQLTSNFLTQQLAALPTPGKNSSS